MTEEPGANVALDEAIQRRDRAVAQLELRIGAVLTQASGANTDLFEQDRAHLAAELDQARGRERALETAGLQASIALGRAIADIRAALGEDFDEAADADIHSSLVQEA